MEDKMKSTSTTPVEGKPISPWEYFARDILYSLPIAGLIIALICAFDKNNINVRNHARGKLIFVIIWFAFIMVYLVFLALVILGTVTIQ